MIEACSEKKHHSKKKKERYRETDVARRVGWRVEKKKKEEKKHGQVDC